MIALLALAAGASAVTVVQFESFTGTDSTCSNPLPLATGLFAFSPDVCNQEDGGSIKLSVSGSTVTLTVYVDTACETVEDTQTFQDGECALGNGVYGRFSILDTEVVEKLWTFSGYETFDCTGTRETRSGSGVRCKNEEGAGIRQGTDGDGLAHFDVFERGNCAEDSVLTELTLACNTCVEYLGIGSMRYDCTSSSASVVSSLFLVLGMLALLL